MSDDMDEVFYIEPDPKHFKAMIEALNQGVTAKGSIEAVWAEDKLFPTTFDVISSDHPWVMPGDRVVVIGSRPRPQG